MTRPEISAGRRLFAAIFPPRHLVESLEGVLAGAPSAAPGLSRVAPDRWHVTLWFLGTTPEDRRLALNEVLSDRAAQTRSFQCALVGTGAFPSEVQPHVLWARVDDPDGHWRSLADSLKGPLTRLGFQLDSGSFQPHLTLARAKDPLAGVRAMEEIAARAGSYRRTWRVDSMQLVESLTGPNPRYEILNHYEFGKA